LPEETTVSDADKQARIEELVSHIWMVRTFLKHSEEAEEDDELRDIYRELYDFMMALSGSVAAEGPASYLKMARKKFRKLRDATAQFEEIQPEISSHTNFQMAVRSLLVAVREIGQLLDAEPAAG
jgi:cob(I)alamin adenosyltransferase